MNLKVIQNKKISNNSFSIIFEKPDGLNYYPAQYLTLYHNRDNRIFSLSSSPTEDYLMITSRPGISDFKKNMQNLKPGDLVESDHPAGTYTLDTRSPAVMLAGGIGITPMRSMIKYALDQNLNLPITLIYSNSNSDFIFKKELGEWQKIYPKLTIHYVVTSQNGRLDETKLATIVGSFVNRIFYLAGPPRMVDDFENALLKMGIDSTNIRTDRFDGY